MSQSPLWVFYNVIIWLIGFIIAYTHYKNQNNSGAINSRSKAAIWIFYVLALLFSLYTFFGGDAQRYEEFVTSGYLDYDNELVHEHEEVYVWIARFVKGNFLLWKVIVYGLALSLVYQSSKRLKCNNYTTILGFSLLAFLSYGATRGVLAYSVFVFGLSFLDDKKLLLRIIGIGIIISSIAFHSSMLPLVLFTPLTYFRVRKSGFVLILIVLIVILSSIAGIFSGLLENIDIFGFSGQKLLLYADELSIDVNYNRGLLIDARLYCCYGLNVWGVIKILKADINQELPLGIDRIGRICLYLCILSLVILASPFPGNTIVFTRYMTMINFYIFFTWSTLLSHDTRNNRNYLYFAIFYAFLSVFNIVYYTIDV